MSIFSRPVQDEIGEYNPEDMDFYGEMPDVFEFKEPKPKKNDRLKILFFYNPYAGSGMFKNNLDIVIAKLQSAGYLPVPVRAAEGLVIELAMRSIDPSEYRQVIIAGGDGTINICVNAMVRNNIDLPVALFPAGTANNYAEYFGIPGDIDGMIKTALGNAYVEADVGKCNDRCFVNATALGTLADISQNTNEDLKNTLGTSAYYMKGLTKFISLKPTQVRLITDDAVYDENMMFALVMNGKMAGGFKNLSPETDVNDGELDVLLFRKMPYIQLPYMLIRVLKGDHIKNDKVLSFSTPKLRIECDSDISTDVDGESGEKFPLEFSVLHKRLKIFTPRGINKESEE